MLPSSSKLIFICKPEPKFESFSIQQYIEYSEISYILSEAAKIFLRKPQTSATATLPQFFQQYVRGQHVLLKAFLNFQKSSFSRLCFVSNFSKIFEIQEQTAGVKTGLDYIQLVRLVCSDFPREMIVNALKLASGNFDLSEQIVMEKNIKGKQFTKGLFMSCLYSNLIKDLQSMSSFKISQLLQYIRQSYKKKRMQFQKPSYKTIIDSLIKLSPTSISSITFVTQDTISNYISSNETVTCSKFLNTLYWSDLNQRQIFERLQFFDVLSLRVTQISKILQDKEEGTNQIKQKKKKK